MNSNRAIASISIGLIFLVLLIAPGGALTMERGPVGAKQATTISTLVIEDLTGPLTPYDLASNLVGSGVAISNVTYTGAEIGAGLFSGGDSVFGFDDGVILGSGAVTVVVGPNQFDNVSTDNFTVGDDDLDALSGFPTYDAAVLEFDFIPSGDIVFFNFVFSSDEYNEFVHSEYNDVFAFFINGVNCATVLGDPVSVNTINNGNPYGTEPNSHPELFVNNDLTDGGGSIDTEMDGLTLVLTCTSEVVANQTNYMKLAIADASDHIWDANVFLEAGSIASGVTCLYGNVTDEHTGDALSDVTVSLQNLANNQSVTKLTGLQGQYSFTDLEPGNYLFTATLDGYDLFNAWLSLGQGCSSLSPQLTFIESAVLWSRVQDYAPDFYQDTDDSKPEADFITAFDYDGDWFGENNWQNLDFFPIEASVYWDGDAETDSHYFLEYYFYHPRDWGESQVESLECINGEDQETDQAILAFGNVGFCHENDMEAAVIAVNKTTGLVDNMVLVHHFLPAPCFLQAAEPSVYSDTRGHALRCAPPPTFPGGDGVIYTYTGTPEEPPSGNAQDVGYQLIHVHDLESRRSTVEGNQAFTDHGCKFRGNDYDDDRATTPWCMRDDLIAALAWLLPLPLTPSTSLEKGVNFDDALLASEFPGDPFTDPARFFAAQFPSSTYSLDYVTNTRLNESTAYSPNTGGWVVAPLGDTSVYLPPFALDDTAIVTITYRVPNVPMSFAGVEGSYFLVDQPFSLEARLTDGAIVTSLNVSATVEILYSPLILSEGRFNTSTLGIMWWNGSTWNPLATHIDIADSKAQAQIDFVGTLGLFARKLESVYLPHVVTR